jgi:predicted CDP-diglyceride synthetase/phosphatidate cytidylyltransferase
MNIFQFKRFISAIIITLSSFILGTIAELLVPDTPEFIASQTKEHWALQIMLFIFTLIIGMVFLMCESKKE